MSSSATDKKSSLLASLTGDDLLVEAGSNPTSTSESSSDLFGSVPPVQEDVLEEDEAPPLAIPEATDPLSMSSATATATASVPFAAPAAPPTPSSSSFASKLLEGSGLLSSPPVQKNANGNGTDSNVDLFATANGGGGGGGGGGLFDEIDAEQERLEQEEERRRQQEKEQERKRQEQAAAAAEAEAEKNRLKQQQEQRARLQQQQQQQLQQQQYMHQQYMQQQQMASQMQSVTLSNSMPTLPTNPPPPQQQQQQRPQPQQYHMQPQLSPGFYRPHHEALGGGSMTTSPPQHPAPPSNAYHGSMLYYSATSSSTSAASGGTAAAAQSPGMPPPPASPSTPPHTSTTTAPRPSITAGMHNLTNMAMPPNVRRTIVQPEKVEATYTNIVVSDPLLVQESGGLLNVVGVHSPPHWSYQVTATLAGNNRGTWLVRRRFRHVVALEDRLRQECPGSILPPRPDKHATRALEEASSTQTPEFATQRASELQVYLNALAHHPIAGQSSTLRLFLSLQDDMGTAWPEVSRNAFTRLGAVGAGAAVMVAETSASLAEGTTERFGMSPFKAGEDNAELLALASSEGLRMGAVAQAVPKLEGSVSLMREQGELAGACGMELNKLTKELEASDKDLTVPLQILSSGLLRGGRRSKRLAVELSAAMTTFVTQYKLCRSEQRAFQDRKHALQKCQKERVKADQRAQRLLLQQRAITTATDLDRAERDAVVSDELAVDAVQECNEIGARLKSEVNRVAFERRTEWSKSTKIIASAMKEACSERVAIWESTRESFLQAFPEEQSGVASTVSS